MMERPLAEDIYQLVTKLGFKSIFLVGHDIGVLIAYPYAAAHPTEVKALAVMESPIPGFYPPHETCIMVDPIPSNTRHTGSPCPRK